MQAHFTDQGDPGHKCFNRRHDCETSSHRQSLIPKPSSLPELKGLGSRLKFQSPAWLAEGKHNETMRSVKYKWCGSCIHIAGIHTISALPAAISFGLLTCSYPVREGNWRYLFISSRVVVRGLPQTLTLAP